MNRSNAYWSEYIHTVFIILPITVMCVHVLYTQDCARSSVPFSFVFLSCNSIYVERCVWWVAFPGFDNNQNGGTGYNLITFQAWLQLLIETFPHINWNLDWPTVSILVQNADIRCIHCLFYYYPLSSIYRIQLLVDWWRP